MNNHSKLSRLEYKNFRPDSILDNVPQSFFSPDWGPEELLEQNGRFELSRVAATLNLSTPKVKQEADQLQRLGRSPLQEMGILRTTMGWFVEMEAFRPFYLETAIHWVQNLKPSWDGNQLFAQEGVFYLTEVCQVIPFKPSMVRSQANKAVNSKATIGVWKDEELKAYLVEMRRFAPWIREVWGKTCSE